MYTPNILVNKVLDYDVIQQVKMILYAQVCEINLNLNVFSPDLTFNEQVLTPSGYATAIATYSTAITTESTLLHSYSNHHRQYYRHW